MDFDVQSFSQKESLWIGNLKMSAKKGESNLNDVMVWNGN
jgi:hypothetical protein